LRLAFCIARGSQGGVGGRYGSDELNFVSIGMGSTSSVNTPRSLVIRTLRAKILKSQLYKERQLWKESQLYRESQLYSDFE